ncbi:MAG: Hpt domain-containing protein [Bacteroidetes bacterium]|nr:Hpt domain-containing protein [Bacteroidota bacterium]
MSLSKVDIMELFLVEGSEHARDLELSLSLLDGKPSQTVFNDMHVHAHTIKGAAAMVGFMNTSHVSRFLERVLYELVQEKLPFDNDVKVFIVEATGIVHKFIRNITVGELNEAIILKDIAGKYDRIISKLEVQNA